MTLNARSYTVFDILIKIVTFDIFPPHENLDFIRFEKSESWSKEFAWLGYDSSNFFELLGSINIYVAYLCIRGLMILLVRAFKCAFKRKSLKDFSTPHKFGQDILLFLLETFFEISIACAISFKLFEIREIWGLPEYIAVG